MLCDSLNIVDHYKSLARIFGVSDDLYGFASFDTTEAAEAAAAAAETKRLAEIKYKKDQRQDSIDRNMLVVLEFIAEIFEISTEELIESIAESETKTDGLHRFFAQNGLESLVASITSNLDEPKCIDILNDKEYIQTDQCAVVYRSDSTVDVTIKNIPNIINISDIKPNANWSMPYVLSRIFREIWLAAFIHFGQCENADTVMILTATEHFLENCDNITKNAISLDINKEIYDENLSDDQKIERTAQNRQLVSMFEKLSAEWMRIIERNLIKGRKIRCNSSETGPIDELEYWLQTHSMYSIAQELISTQTFKHHLRCLQLSGSKLVNKWKMIEHQLNMANYEASDNVLVLNSLERFQFPFYGKINDIKAHVDPLFGALRTVYNTSAFYNTPNAMAIFLSKCTNHLTLCCRNFIADGSTSNLFLQPPVQLLEKISVCLELLDTYQKAHDSTIKQMDLNSEAEWDFSEMYVFGQVIQLSSRLSKLQNIIETNIKYAILENILIENIEDYFHPINQAYEEITSKSYDHLDFREERFDTDFLKWQATIKEVEKKMNRFVNEDIHKYPTRPSIALNHVRRFEDLHFDCLSIGNRYVDIVVAFVNDINALKDSFNLKRLAPVVPNLMCTYSGRMSWVRSIERKLNEVMSLLNIEQYFNDKNQIQVQKTIKYYNALSKDLVLYEAQQFKAWFDNVHHVFDLLGQPVIRRNMTTNRIESNFDIMILNTIEESKKMVKLHLDIPQLGEALLDNEADLRRKWGAINLLIEINSHLRHSIPVVFVNIFRPQLKKIDKAFNPGLSQIQWLSKDFDAYIDNVQKVLDDVKCLIKNTFDKKIFHIDDIILSMAELKLLVLFDQPTYIDELLDANKKHRKVTAEILEVKSTMAEKATIELVNIFIDHTEIITDEDKFDFIDFEKLFRQVSVYNEGDHIEPLFKDYIDLNYGIKQLHSDCMDLLNYFLRVLLDTLIASLKDSYEKTRERFFLREEAAILATAKLDTSSCCYLSPQLDSISKSFLILVHGITDIFSGMDSWGSYAAISGSKRYDLAEINLQHGFLDNVVGNKEIQRTISKFESGLSLLQPAIDSLMEKVYTKYQFLWSDDLEKRVIEFVKSDPFPSEIEDEFVRCQSTLDELNNAEKLTQISCIAVDLNEVYTQLIAYASKWKRDMAADFARIYKDKFDVINDFMFDTDLILRRELKEDEDFTAVIERMLASRLQSIRRDRN